ncbi:hypothetical protein K491DRAFT_721160 [Lophiostoma macrostomum CBS 122681]|uniref:CFEM domain-containing protein n=1 Tax=Lophiostoma macrostomum CBS 122681 TaxID=1314788 RepID=A0A6A6SSJ8_9PLEO|nr:hypothetical protein K491DRAFT_721160 [Lophiostoma macrostomum CBS 122681]
MKTAFISTLALAFVTSVSAQSACDSAASAVPTCGVPCIQSAASAVGCDNTNYSCRCSNAAPIQSSAQACVISNCGLATALQVQASASAVCACVATATGAAAKPKRTAAPGRKF